MEKTEINEPAVEVKRAYSYVMCPECGAWMRRIYKCQQNSVLFVLYECSRHDCKRHWLKKL